MKKRLSFILLAAGIPALLFIGNYVFKNKQYSFISLGVVILAIIPFLLSFEKNENNIAKLVVIAVMTALSVAGRVVFSALPAFKPVSAIVILVAINFGSEAGFMTGALSALISNFYYTQGPWTPFQMFAWGAVGLIAGLLARPLKKHFWALLIYGAFAGVMFSMIMDIWNAMWQDNRFVLARYFASIATSLPFTFRYAYSNVLFLLVLAVPVNRILDRIRTKYGIS